MPWRSDAAGVSTAASAEAASLVVLLVTALLAAALGPAFAVIASAPGSVLASVLASVLDTALTARATRGRRMATGGFAVTLTPTIDSSGAFRLAGVREQRGRWPVSRERRPQPRAPGPPRRSLRNNSRTGLA